MLDNSRYDLIKILHELSKLAWFIEKHAQPGLQQGKHQERIKAYKDLLQDLEKHLAKIKEMM